MSTALVLYHNARNALANCHRVDEVKKIHDKAMAMQVYAKQAQDRELIVYATEIRERAEIRAGELLTQMKERGERRAQSDGKPKRPNGKLQLGDLGITNTQSSRWQKKAAKPKGEQEAGIERKKAQAASKRKKRADKKTGAENLRNMFLANCTIAVRSTVYHGPVDEKVCAAARRVANAWTSLAEAMEKIKWRE